MNIKKLFLIILFILFAINIFADLGPKPTMNFYIKYNTTNNITLLDAKQYECEDINCEEIKLLEDYGPQRFICKNDSFCHSLAYSYLPYQKLVLRFSDKKRETSIFNSKSFNAEFEIIVTDSGLLMGELGSNLLVENNNEISFFSNKLFAFFKSLVITLFLELIVAYIYLFRTKISKKVLNYIFIVNLISLPFVWFVFPLFEFISIKLLLFIISEIFVILFEAYFVYKFNKSIFSFKKILVLSIIMNFVSVILGRLFFVFFN